MHEAGTLATRPEGTTKAAHLSSEQLEGHLLGAAGLGTQPRDREGCAWR